MLFLERATRLHTLDLIRLSIALSHCGSQRIPSHFTRSGSAIILLIVLALLEYANIYIFIIYINIYIIMNCSPHTISMYGSFQAILSF